MTYNVLNLKIESVRKSLWISTGNVEPLFSTETHPSSSLMFTFTKPKRKRNLPSILPLWKKHSKNSQQAKTPRKGQKRFFSALPPASLFPKCLQRFGLDVGHVIWIALKVITGIHQDLIKDFVEAGNEVDLRIPFDAARGWNAISGWQSSSSPSRVPSKVLASLWTIFCLASSQTHSLQHSNNKSIQASRSDLFNDMFNDMFNEDCSASLSASQWTRHRCLVLGASNKQLPAHKCTFQTLGKWYLNSLESATCGTANPFQTLQTPLYSFAENYLHAK